MADQVQINLEKMIPEIEDLRIKKIFSKKEIKQIIQKRTKFEYSINKRNPEKKDFLRYIQYEIELDEKRKRKKIKKKMDKVNSISDHSIIQRIHYIFKKALSKFSNDLELWKKYFDFCKKVKSTNQLSKAYALAIQKHPYEVSFWISAARFEYFTNKNMNGSRVLFQRGLRINKESKKLWIEYCKIELLYIRKIKKRWNILGLLPSTIKLNEKEEMENYDEEMEEEKEIIEEDKELINNKEEKNSNINIPVLEIEHNFTNEQKELLIMKESDQTIKNEKSNLFLKGEIPKIIFKNAIKTISNDLSFRLDFISLFKKYEFPEVMEEVYESLKKDFPNNLDCLQILAFHINHIDNVNQEMNAFQQLSKLKKSEIEKSLEIFDYALKNVENDNQYSSILNKYAQFCLKILENSINQDIENFLKSSLFNIFNLALEKNCSQEWMFLKWIELIKNHNSKMALTIVDKGLEKFPSSSSMWILKINIIMKEDPSDKKKIKKLFKKALSVINNKESISLWNHFFEFCFITEIEFEKIFNYYINAIKKLGFFLSDNNFRENFLERILFIFGIENARKIYKQTLLFPPITLNYYKKCINLEKNCLVKDEKQIRLLYEKIIDSFNLEDEEIWLEYIQWEIENKEFKRANLLEWKLLKLKQLKKK